MNVDMQDKLTEMHMAIDKAIMIEHTIYSDYLEGTQPEIFLEGAFERMQTLHNILNDYLKELRGTIAEAESLNKHTPEE